MLETTTVLLKKKDVQQLSPQFLEITKPYVPIFQWCYGRMDDSTPWKGLGTAGVISCTAVILHCNETRRTILSHSPNFLQMNTFIPMLDWCAGGVGDQQTMFERVAWRYGGKKSSTSSLTPVTIEAVVLRGQDYASPRAQYYGHDGWMADFRELCTDVQKSKSHTINVTDHSHILKSAAVLVDKGTGRITFFALDSSLRGAAITNIENPTADDYSSETRQRDLFVGGFWNVKRETFDINLQWNLDRACHGIPLPDPVRELIRSAKLGEPTAVRSEILKRCGHSDWISLEADSLETTLKSFQTSQSPQVSQEIMVLRQSFSGMLSCGLPCERCPKAGKMACTGCKGAWYCGQEHQKEDWKAHKGWCKSHKIAA